jgi:hypothetical protein
MELPHLDGFVSRVPFPRLDHQGEANSPSRVQIGAVIPRISRSQSW